MRWPFPDTAPCEVCGRDDVVVARALGACLACIRGGQWAETPAGSTDATARLHPRPPRDPDGVRCTLCQAECRLGPGRVGLCGVSRNEGGALVVQSDVAFAHLDVEGLPRRCDPAHPCGEEASCGTTAVVRFHGCNLHCAFCETAPWRQTAGAPVIERAALVERVVGDRYVGCVRFSGGSPEPHLPFALAAAEAIVAARDDVRICWEWNGTGRPELVRKAVALSAVSGGVVKFDLKAWSEPLAIALTGASNRGVIENFRATAAQLRDQGGATLTASTLLVPGYVDAEEIDGIARFVAEVDPAIPYALLVCEPSDRLRDLPVTADGVIDACATAARRHLGGVRVERSGYGEA